MPHLNASKGFRFLSLSASTSTGAGTAVTLDTVCTKWGVYCVTPTSSAQFILRLGAASSSDAGMTEVVTWNASSDSGLTVWSTVDRPALRADVLHNIAATSAGATGDSAWLIGAP